MSCIALCDPPNWKIVSLCIFDRLESRTFWWINILNILSFLSATNPNWYMSHDDRSNDDLMSLSLVTTLNELDNWIRPLGWNKELYDIDSITAAGRKRRYKGLKLLEHIIYTDFYRDFYHNFFDFGHIDNFTLLNWPRHPYLWNREVSETKNFKLETLVVVIPKYSKCDLWSVFSNSTEKWKRFRLLVSLETLC